MGTGYLSQAVKLDLRAANIKASVEQLAAKTHLFDAIAFRGMSGSLLAPSVADILGKHLIVVRKPSNVERSHGLDVEFDCAPGHRWIIFDDFKSSGATCQEIWKALKAHRFGDPVAAYFYSCWHSTGSTQEVKLNENISCPIWGRT